MDNYINNLDPCCGVPLKTGSKFIAMIDMINCIATGVFVGFLLIVTLFFGDDLKRAIDKDQAEFPDEVAIYDYMGNGMAIWVLILITVLSVLYFLLAQSLLHGSQKKDVQKITRWIQITAILLFVRIASLVLAVFLTTDSVGLLFFVFLHTIYTVYCLWVVYRFRKELMTEESMTLRQSQWGNHSIYKL